MAEHLLGKEGVAGSSPVVGSRFERMSMRVAVVGSRSFADYERLRFVLNGLTIGLIISGGARGADKLAERYAEEHGIETKVFLPDWDAHGKSAGFLRNEDIVRACDMLVAFWDGKSKGTQHSIRLADEQDKNLVVIQFDSP